ncbi:hypothetical protein MPH_01542 [Macrophomina phaseolina MS6]|uniref:Rhodopsin domain-containing protein n=1 Tax=Macrophomina phaseolina (strain MS6) TaxID=1126212 RepID=K2S2F8_MACPH|nr:hypothetical protein MPH_01542 [Macrophomina phaseolina MS6]
MRTLRMCYASMVLSFLFLALKLGVRSCVVRNLGWDDLFVTVSFLTSVPLTASIYMQAKHGLGVHAYDLPVDHLVEQTRWFWISILLYVAALGLSKISILTQYLRIFISRRTVIAIWACVAFVSGYTLQGLIVGVFQCTPPKAFWDRTIRATCINQIAYFFIAASLSIITDFAIILLPIPALRSLHVSRSRKIGLILSFAIGGFGCVVSLIRLHALVQLKPYVASGDLSFENVNTAMWSVVEVHICIICACLPSLRPVLTRFLALTGFGRSSIHSNAGKSPSPGNNLALYYSSPAHQEQRREAASLSILSATFFDSAHAGSASGSRQNSLRTYINGGNSNGNGDGIGSSRDLEMGNTTNTTSYGKNDGDTGKRPPQPGQIEVETRLEVHSTITSDADITTLVESRTGSRGSSRESEELRLVPAAHRGWYRALVERDRR